RDCPGVGGDPPALGGEVTYPFRGDFSEFWNLLQDLDPKRNFQTPEQNPERAFRILESTFQAAENKPEKPESRIRAGSRIRGFWPESGAAEPEFAAGNGVSFHASSSS